MKIRRAIAVALTLAALTVAATGCSQKYKEYGRDAAVASHDDQPARVINNPDGFSNVSAKCDGPNMVYVAFHGDSSYASIAVAPNDPRCADGAVAK